MLHGHNLNGRFNHNSFFDYVREKYSIFIDLESIFHQKSQKIEFIHILSLTI